MQPEVKTTPKRARAALVAAALLSGMFAVPLTSANAATVDLPLAQTAWFWSSNQKYTFCAKDPVLGACQAFILSDGGPRGLAPVPPGTFAPITYGHLGVSVINGASDMRAYAKLDLSSIPPDSLIESMVLRLNISLPTQEHTQQHLDATGKVPATFFEQFARIDACPMTEPWGPAEGDAPYAFTFQRPELENQSTDINMTSQRNEPQFNCGKGRIRGQMTTDLSAIEWDLTSVAQAWADNPVANEGVALIGVAEGPINTWMVELHGQPLTLVATTPGVPVPVPVPLPDPDLPPNEYVKPKDAGFATTSFSAKPPEEEDDGGTVIIERPGDPIFVPQPQPVPFPIVQPPPPAPPPTTFLPPVAAPGGEARTPAWVFLAFPLGLLGIGALLGAIGNDPLAAGAVPIAGSRVAMMLRQRRLGGS